MSTHFKKERKGVEMSLHAMVGDCFYMSIKSKKQFWNMQRQMLQMLWE